MEKPSVFTLLSLKSSQLIHSLSLMNHNISPSCNIYPYFPSHISPVFPPSPCAPVCMCPIHLSPGTLPNKSQTRYFANRYFRICLLGFLSVQSHHLHPKGWSVLRKEDRSYKTQAFLEGPGESGSKLKSQRPSW